MSLIEKLLRIVDTYCDATGANERQLGERIFGDRRRFERLRSGEADLKTKSLEAAVCWLSDNWPAAVSWPEQIDRPEARSDEAAA